MSLVDVLADLDVRQADLHKPLGLSRSAVSRLVLGQWPAKRPAEVRQALIDYLKTRGAKPAHLRGLVLAVAKKLAPVEQQLAEAVPPEPSEDPKEESMLLQMANLTPEARKHFGLVRNPFVDEIHTHDDVFQTSTIRYVRNALMDAAQNHGFIAIVGQSGAGKSTLAKDLEERINTDKRDIVIIRPYVLAMEANDVKGKTLKATHIAESIASALDPNLKVKSSPEARFKQVHELLLASFRAGRRHLILIEEAHSMPTATLKHLKRFLELTAGFRRLIGVALVAQPELLRLLNSQNQEVREVMQRCEVVQLPALDADVEGYLRLKLARCSVKLEDVFEADAVDAIRARLISTPRGGKPSEALSECHPLAVNNLVSRAMNAAVIAGWPKVDAQVIAGC